MKIHLLDPASALASLHVSAAGLSSSEAARRQQEFGRNQLQEAAQTPLWLKFLREFSHFFALILWVGAALAFFAAWRQPGEGMATLGFAILLVILINGLFSFWQEYRAETAINALQRLLPHRVKVLRDGHTQELDADQLVPGDIIFVQEGDQVPADCRLLEGFGVQVNNSALTGESVPAPREVNAPAGTELQQAHNLLFAGTSVVTGNGRALVFATGGHTAVGNIARLSQHSGDQLSPLQLEIRRLSHFVAILACSLGAVFFLIGAWIGLPLWSNLMFAIGIIVANVPEGLLPTVTLSLAMASQRMARRNALIRHLPAVETLGSTTVICTDKTGTLTQNRMAVRALHLEGRVVTPDELPAGHVLREILGYCHDLRRGADGWLGDPMEVALVSLAESSGALGDSARLLEQPFDTRRKRMAVLQRHAGGARVYLKGALETVLPLCRQQWCGNAVQPLEEPARQAIIAAHDALAERGLRILVLAWRPAQAEESLDSLEQGLLFAGLVGLEDPPRAEVPAAIRQCRSAGIRVIMVTGDNPRTACAIGREIGLLGSNPARVITGEQLAHLSDIQLQLALDQPDILFARVAAEQKMRIVKALQGKQQVVAVTGDGVNDAPALKQADIGIAMGRSGTDVARGAADMILLDDNFASIVAAVEEGRAVFANLRKFLTYILSSNIPELVPYLAYVLLRIPLPLTVIQILAVDLGTDMLPALALGAEKPDAAVMRQPPRPFGEHLLNRTLLWRAYGFLGILEAAAALTAYFFVLDASGWRYGTPLASDDPLYLTATSACFATIVVMQVVNVFLCRHPSRSTLGTGLFSNPLLFGAIAVELGLLGFVIYTPWGNQLFATHPLPADVWLLAGACALLMLLLEELRKWLQRRSETPRLQP
ncbi:cation-translocating P-type ATPase [Pseudomonas sp. N040]|uniref:cation-translocating P-type ATPase n=1 Tax=Pseudomonas sp. N040 TaxID=2785325 RepID=UPI0018A2F43B|nr:cation-transporting P-type ATPase [Pseudomonas sp. N040]MBF7731699.1 cation-transporting P-type ATPase [Pseudomonas sp. N040]MBW7015343.1 cation-transporting P-type ATPase [Pseudomonas sp. N040]